MDWTLERTYIRPHSLEVLREEALYNDLWLAAEHRYWWNFVKGLTLVEGYNALTEIHNSGMCALDRLGFLKAVINNHVQKLRSSFHKNEKRRRQRQSQGQRHDVSAPADDMDIVLFHSSLSSLV